MFQRFHAMREQREGGFTLIELLVVILIIAILAAIAIPVFLNQRRKGWSAQAESAVKNMATSEESYLTANTSYTTSLSALMAEGFTYSSADVTPTAPIGTTQRYCVKAVSTHDANIIWYYDSNAGAPTQTQPTGC